MNTESSNGEETTAQDMEFLAILYEWLIAGVVLSAAIISRLCLHLAKQAFQVKLTAMEVLSPTVILLREKMLELVCYGLVISSDNNGTEIKF